MKFIEDIALGMLKDCRFEHTVKADCPNLFIEFGISIFEREEHPQKAPSPISVTELGIYTDLSD